MSIYTGTAELDSVYVGTTVVDEIYIGTTKVRPDGGGGGGWTPGANTILYFPLQSDTKDVIANVSISTPAGGSTPTYETPTGVSISCAKFSKGVWKMSGTVSQLINSNGARTISGWVYPTDSTSRFSIASYGTSSTNQAFSLYTYDGSSSNNKLRFTSYNNNSNYGTASINTNTWYNIIVTYSGGSSGVVKWYVNGVQDGSYSINLSTTKNRCCLGTDSTTSSGIVMPSGGLKGYLSSVIFEKVAWSATDVLNYYNNNKSIYGIS